MAAAMEEERQPEEEEEAGEGEGGEQGHWMAFACLPSLSAPLPLRCFFVLRGSLMVEGDEDRQQLEGAVKLLVLINLLEGQVGLEPAAWEHGPLEHGASGGRLSVCSPPARLPPCGS